MCRSELIRAVRARGANASPSAVEYWCQAGRLDPPPRLDGSNRRVFEAAHVEQVVALTRARGKRASALTKECAS
jgi:hypothetical protein